MMEQRNNKKAAEFLRLLKMLNHEQQAGIALMVEGAELLEESKKKRRIIRRSP